MWGAAKVWVAKQSRSEALWSEVSVKLHRRDPERSWGIGEEELLCWVECPHKLSAGPWAGLLLRAAEPGGTFCEDSHEGTGL